MECQCCPKVVIPLHEHHIIPQSCGGTDGPTAMLCSDCHNLLHLLVNKQLSAYRKGGKAPTSIRYIDEVRQSDGKLSMEKLVGVAVQAFILKMNQDPEFKVKVTLELDPLTHNALKVLKMRVNGKSGNLPSIALMCIQKVLREQGLLPLT